MPNDNIVANDDDAAELPSLMNSIVLFREYGYYGTIVGEDADEFTFVPTRDILSIKNTEKHIFKNLSVNFIKNRIPYLYDENTKNIEKKLK